MLRGKEDEGGRWNTLFALVACCLGHASLQPSLNANLFVEVWWSLLWTRLAMRYFIPRGGSKIHLQSLQELLWRPQLGSAYTCHRVNKAPWEDSGLAEHLGHTLSKLSPRCACRTDSPSASCHAQNVYPICQDNLSSNKLGS